MYQWADADHSTLLHEGGASIPANLGNRDYRKALAWEAAGNTIAAYQGPSLQSVKTRYRSMIDDDAEGVRLRYVTPGAGMAMTYQEKFAQAQAVAAMGEQSANAMSEADRLEQFPTLAASVGIEESTIYACAQLVLARYAAFAAMSYQIERARLQGKAAVAAASDVQGVVAAYEAVAWPTQ
jgi:hypothetical protein